MLARLAHLTVRYRWPMIALWLFLTVVGVFGRYNSSICITGTLVGA